MGIFGIKKANEEPKSNNTFINDAVINAADYSNMPNNTVVGYNQSTDVNDGFDQVIMNVDQNNYNNGETFVYSQVNTSDFSNQFVNNTNNESVNSNYYDQNNMYMNQVDGNQQVYNNDVVMTVPNNSEFSSADVSQEVDASVVPQDSQVMFSNVELPATQDFSTVEQVPFDNSALFALPAGAVVEEEVVEEEVVIPEVVVEEEPKVVLDPLNNANNPIPVNPVALPEVPKIEEVVEEEQPLFDEEEEVKTNLFTVINMMVGVIIKPGTTISQNARRYKRFFDAFIITFWVTILSFVMSLAGRIVAGCFSRTQNAISGSSKIVLDFSGLLDTNNYVPYLLITLLIGLGAILIVALTYYIASFVCSKGIHIGTYFAISTLALVPVIVSFTVLFPIISIISTGIGLAVLIFSIIYALIILFNGINEVLKFKSNDARILYNSVNMAIILSIMVFVFRTLSTLNILDISMLI